GALGDDGVGRQLVQAFLTVDLVNAIDLIIGTARGGRVADDDLVLPLGVEQVLPALGGFFALELFVVDHDDHDVRIGADPQVVGAQKALVHAFGFGRIVGLEVVLERGHGAETGAPDHITQGVGGLGFDTLHERAGAGGDTLHGQIAGLVLGNIQCNVDDLHVVRGVDDRFGSQTRGAEAHGGGSQDGRG